MGQTNWILYKTMRKFVFTISFACIGAVSGMAQGYSIRGTVSPDNDGKKIYLVENKNNRYVRLDSAVIKNCFFRIDGKVETPRRACLVLNVRGREVTSDFLLENSVIAVNVNTQNEAQFVIMGTPANNAYLESKKITADIRAQSQSCLDQAAAAKDNKAKKDSIYAVLGGLSGKMNQALEELMEANKTNYQGLIMAMSKFGHWPVARSKEFLANVPEELHNTAEYKTMSTVVSLLENTSEGKYFTDLTGKTPEGKPVKLSKYAGKGKYVLVDFWASWCVPCMAEMPNVAKAYKEFKSKGLEIVGVSLDDKLDAWKKAIAAQKMTWPQMSDLKGWRSENASVYGVRGIPMTVLIDRKGNILARELRGEALLKKLKELMP